jgi:hypothetical protein
MMETNCLRLLVALSIHLATATARADMFTYVNEQGETIEVEARLTGSGDGLHALELDNGQVLLVPQAAVRKRVPGPGPKPISIDTMIERLTAKFEKDRFRFLEQDPFVVGLVLSSPLPKSSESHVRSFLKKASRFMISVERNFAKFTRKMKLPTQKTRYPMVVLIFESGSDFEEYATEATGGQGLSAGNITGFYSMLTNYLALRMSECRSFAVPLHEAIHQQVYNRRVLQRLAAIPVWYNEGIATGFEGNGDRINSGPLKINTNFARRAKSFSRIDWSMIVESDRAFGGDILAGDAYTHAWSLHWLLASKYKAEYTQYVKLLSQKKPLQKEEPEQRAREFKETFGKTVEELQDSFPLLLNTGIRQQKIKLDQRTPAGLSVTSTGLAEVKMNAVQRLDLGGVLLVNGSAKNISPIRNMAYHITVETNSGLYADWYLPSLRMNKTFTLKQQPVRKRMTNAPGGLSRTFRVKVRSAAPSSAEAQKWKRGQLPVPVYGR